METSVHLSSSQGSTTTEIAAEPYREAVGKLIYASFGILRSLFSQNSWTIPDRTPRGCRTNFSLPGWNERTFNLRCKSKELTGYADADSASINARSQERKRCILEREIATLSTTESEYVAGTHAAKEALWLRSLISEILLRICHPRKHTLFRSLHPVDGRT